jgi:perosamine synthetase
MAFLPYGRQSLDADDEAAVLEVLRSPWLTTGPKVAEFEAAFAQFCGAREAVAVSSGTAALHCALYAVGIGPADEVIVPPMTFAATANAVLYQGARPVFADVDPHTLLIDPVAVAACITPRTKAIIAVDYAGQPCDYDALRALADAHGLVLVADGCHAPGATYKGRTVGTLADLTTFSFHPVKHLTTAEGGMITTDNPEWAARMRTFRNHGITTDHRQREERGTWFYEMSDLGYNYRLSDLQCVLGLSQLKKLPGWLLQRRALAAHYDQLLADLPQVQPLRVNPGVEHAYHLYVVRIPERDHVFQAFKAAQIGANVHYIPVYLHPYYQQHANTFRGLCPQAEDAYPHILSLPLFPLMSIEDVNHVIRVLTRALLDRATVAKANDCV